MPHVETAALIPSALVLAFIFWDLVIKPRRAARRTSAVARIRQRRARRDFWRAAGAVLGVAGIAAIAIPCAVMFGLALGQSALSIGQHQCTPHVTHGGAVHCLPR